MKKKVRLTESQLNTYISKVVSEQTLRTGNLQAPEDMDPNPMQKPKSDFGIKNPGMPKFTPDISPEANTSANVMAGPGDVKKFPPAPKLDYNIGGKTPPTPPTASPVLSRGSKGTEVLKYQKALVKIGLSVGDKGPDSDFGPTTEHAVGWFQEKNGLPKTGKIDKATGDKILLKAYGPKMAMPISKPAPPPAKTSPLLNNVLNPIQEMFDRMKNLHK